MKEFNFIIGRYLPDGFILNSALNSDSFAHYGTLEDAQKLIEHLNKQESYTDSVKEYKIFKLTEIQNDYLLC
jgi:hypothetical protein